MNRRAILQVLGLALCVSGSAHAWEPGWSSQIVTRGARRAQINSTHILDRPYRPFHFYGNTVRRRFYRGFSWPLPRDVLQGTLVLVSNPSWER